jgi:7,8-dihydropterin-6-yl-methyl-4-(beta-D-ribofuranosyl)aminobenzene 5'-phosphate synthase
MIQDAKKSKGSQDPGLVVDLHPSRPDYRGFVIADNIISLEADPTFASIEETGATVAKHRDAHTVLDDMFLISGEIPRVTPYEQGLKGAVRFHHSEEEWTSDEKIADERFLMCRLRGKQKIRRHPQHMQGTTRLNRAHTEPPDKGIVLFTGCSHAGVVNTAIHARNLLGGSVPFHAVVGGFHLAASDEAQIESTIRDLKKLDPAVLLPGHCSGWRAKFAIEKHMPGTLVPCTVGVQITF